MHPRARPLDHDDLGGHALQQGAVVADHQDRAAAGLQLVLQPQAGGDVQVVVRLVEQQDVRPTVQQQVEHQALAFAAAELAHQAGGEVLHVGLHAALGGRSPLGFQLVPAEIAPVGEGLGEAGAVVLPRVHRRLGGVEGPAGFPQGGGCHLHQHVAEAVGRVRHADVLGHPQDGAAQRELALVGLQLAREDAQDGALADAVGTDDRRVLARCNREGDVEEQRIRARRRVLEFGHDDAAHGCTSCRIAAGDRAPIPEEWWLDHTPE